MMVMGGVVFCCLVLQHIHYNKSQLARQENIERRREETRWQREMQERHQREARRQQEKEQEQRRQREQESENRRTDERQREARRRQEKEQQQRRQGEQKSERKSAWNAPPGPAWWEVLGIPPDATIAVAQQAYRSKMKQCSR
jgi:hypothetical protein